MADPSLNIPVAVRAFGINASSIPAGYSPAYSQYILSQALDFSNVAGKANEAGQGAYDAQVKNDEQDVTLADHEIRITQAESTLANHETRITQNTNDIAALTVRVVNAESAIATIQSNVATLTTRVTTAEGNITTLQSSVGTLQTTVTAIQSDYVSKTATANQTVQPVSGSLLIGTIATPTADKLQVVGSVNVSVSYKVAGLQVVGTRKTGWTAATGTAYRGTFDANQAWTIGVLNVLQIQEIATALTQARQRIKALEDDLRSHGLIN